MLHLLPLVVLSSWALAGARFCLDSGRGYRAGIDVREQRKNNRWACGGCVFMHIAMMRSAFTKSSLPSELNTRAKPGP